MKVNDTIIAPATTLTTQAIALIRLSGSEALNLINQLTQQSIPDSRGFYFRRLYDQEQLVDEVVITFYNAPASFTGEEVIEIACHGGILNTQRIINLLIQKGARMALKGEFSQRAFLNNKIDLIQAEGINDLIHATNDLALKIGVDNMSGKNNQAILSFKASLMDLISRIQVSIDYPDYDDIEGSTPEELKLTLTSILEQLQAIIHRSKLAMKAIEGIKTAIIGQTNVGKSSLLNALINENKAIVTDIPGTTRDIVEGKINLEGVTINLIDTAGIRQTTDVVESLGINKAKEYLTTAQLILYVVNFDNFNNQENKVLFNQVKNKPHLIILNKAKSLTVNEIIQVQTYFNEEVILTNAVDNDIDDLIKAIKVLYNNDEILKNDDLLLINLNQIALLEKVALSCKNALTNLNHDYPIDIVNVDLMDGWNSLGELIGQEYDEEIIDNIFRKYCLGK